MLAVEKNFPKGEIQKVDFWTDNTNSYMLPMFVEPFFRQRLQPDKAHLIVQDTFHTYDKYLQKTMPN